MNNLELFEFAGASPGIHNRNYGDDDDDIVEILNNCDYPTDHEDNFKQESIFTEEAPVERRYSEEQPSHVITDIVIHDSDSSDEDLPHIQDVVGR